MTRNVFLVTFINFFIGGCVLIVNGLKNKDLGNNRERWVKFVVYVFIVHLVLLSICYHSMIRYVCILIIGMGTTELFNAWKNSKLSPIQLVTSFCVYGIIGMFFFRFSFRGNVHEQLRLYLFVFLFDGFSQIIGQLIGKHKLSPNISPNKTIEGTCGGFISVLIVSLLMCRTGVQSDHVAVVFIPLLIGLFALAGDLLASYYKRLCHIKDFSNLIPAHGGMLDRFDSFIFSGAFYCLLFI